MKVKSIAECSTCQQFLIHVGTFAVLSQYIKACVKRPLKNRQNKDLDNIW